MDFATIIGIISGFVTLEEAGRSIVKDFLSTPKLKIDDVERKDSELLLLIDKLKSELVANLHKCITEEETEQIKEIYFSKHTVPAQYRKDIEAVIDDLLERINTYLDKVLTVGDKVIIANQRGQAAQLSQIQKTNEEILKLLADEKVANSTKKFIRQFGENLFWDNDENSQVPLSKVYVEPKTQNGDSVLKEVDAFLKDNKKYLLFIEAVAGSGKTSFMQSLACLYGDEKHHFYRLSDLDITSDMGLQKALKDVADTDSAWKNYVQEGTVLFLDGYDEIAGRINKEKLLKDIRKFARDHVKIIITTRPNYLNDFKEKHEKINMRVFDEKQIREWIGYYADAKKLSEVNYKPYLEILDDYEKFELIEDVISIPIFLYIMVKKQVDVEHIESQTQLFESVFAQLVDDKIDREQYELHLEIAKRMGYYLQVCTGRTFTMKDVDGFIHFIKNSMKLDIDREELDRMFESSFIKNVTEGEYEKEFYHKSIQDYFSACYIFEQLKEIVENMKNDKQEKAVVMYCNLFYKYDFQAEIEHLSYLFSKEISDKSLWVRSLQEIFGNLITAGINTDGEKWYEQKIQTDSGRVKYDDFLLKYKLITINHSYVMIDILHEGLYCSDNSNLLFLRSIENFCPELFDFTRTQFIWNFFYKQIITGEDILSLIEPDNVLAFMMADNFGIARYIHMIGGTYQLERGQRATGRLENCIVDNIEVTQTKFHELFLEKTILRHCKFISCHYEYADVLNCTMEEITFYSSLYCSHMKDTIIKESEVGNKNLRNPMKIQNSDYTNVTFAHVTFLAINCDSGTSFHDCTFTNCTFSSSIGKDFSWNNCCMDEETKESFIKFH